MKNLYSIWDSKKCFIISLLFLIPSYAQIPESGQDVLKKIAGKELRTYKKLKSSEYTMTSIQEMFDVTYYSIEIKPDPGIQILTGTVEIVCDVLSTSLDSIELNFWDGMVITDIHLSDIPETQLLYSHSNDILAIALDSTFFQGEQIALKVSYYGSPQNSGYGTFDFGTLNGRDLISTTDVTGIMAWCPCKEIFTDKVDFVDFKISVPSELIAASNGKLRNTTVNGDTTTYWWHVQYPISTNFISFAIYPYTVYYDDYLYNNNTDTMKIHFYMVPEHVSQYDEFNSKVKDMITVFAGLFGEYPFVKEKFGMADILTPYSGFMGQTLTSLEYTTYSDRNEKDWWTEWIINHELAHQWWGASVMAYSLHDIWLLEGFATYSSALWYEHLEGAGAASDYMMTDRMLYRGSGTVYVEDISNIDRVFDWDLSYCKAAWVLHMLRHTVTDTVFFEILKTYASVHQYGNATPEDFQAICEQVSGMNLQKFFQQWIYQEYYPFYEYGWTTTPDSTGFRIDLTINQVQQNRVNQNAPLFWMPIDVKITTNSYDSVFVVRDSLTSQSFEFYLDNEPLTIEIDPDNWILKRTSWVDGIDQPTEIIARKFTLFQNYPNPFNPSTTIEFTLPKSEFVTLKIYNILGEEVATLVNDKLQVGNHTYQFDGSNLSSGIYLYRIDAGEFQGVKKMVLIR